MTDNNAFNSWMKVLRADAPATAAATAVERLLAFIVADLPPEHAAHVVRAIAEVTRATDPGAGTPRPPIPARTWESRMLIEGVIVESWAKIWTPINCTPKPHPTDRRPRGNSRSVLMKNG